MTPTRDLSDEYTRWAHGDEGAAFSPSSPYGGDHYVVRSGQLDPGRWELHAAVERQLAQTGSDDYEEALRRGRMRSPVPTTVATAAAEFLAGAKAGTIPKRGGGTFKPSTIRSYERALKKVLPTLGHLKLGDVRRTDMQEIADKLTAKGLAASSVQNAIDPIRVIYRRAIQRDMVSLDPTAGLELRTPKGRRDRIASPGEAARLLAALPDFERVLYATAMYAGLRRGELRALAWEDVDLKARRIHVRRGWDDVEGKQDGKSEAAERDVPVLRPLGRELAAHRLACQWTEGLVFGRSPVVPFAKTSVLTRARAAWKQANQHREPDDQLAPIGLHESRHTCASTFIAAGANPKVIQRVMGHANIAMTFDRYGHLMPGGLEEAAEAADAFLAAEGVLG